MVNVECGISCGGLYRPGIRYAYSAFPTEIGLIGR